MVWALGCVVCRRGRRRSRARERSTILGAGLQWIENAVIASSQSLALNQSRLHIWNVTVPEQSTSLLGACQALLVDARHFCNVGLSIAMPPWSVVPKCSCSDRRAKVAFRKFSVVCRRGSKLRLLGCCDWFATTWPAWLMLMDFVVIIIIALFFKIKLLTPLCSATVEDISRRSNGEKELIPIQIVFVHNVFPATSKVIILW